MFPLFGGIPGGVELIILFIIFLFMLVIPVAVGIGLFLLGRRSADGRQEEVELLRDRVNTLEDKIAAREEVSTDSAGEDTDRER